VRGGNFVPSRAAKSPRPVNAPVAGWLDLRPNNHGDSAPRGKGTRNDACFWRHASCCLLDANLEKEKTVTNLKLLVSSVAVSVLGIGALAPAAAFARGGGFHGGGGGFHGGGGGFHGGGGSFHGSGSFGSGGGFRGGGAFGGGAFHGGSSFGGGFRGGVAVHPSAGFRLGGGAAFGGGYRGGVGFGGGYRGAPVAGYGTARGFGGYHGVPATRAGFAPRWYGPGPGGRVWVPGYWGWRGGVRLWIGDA
jgi:hypothetical protein